MEREGGGGLLQIHGEALAYFLACVRREPLLTRDDAVDLAGEVVAMILPRLQELKRPAHYARTVRRNLLIRFLSRERRRRDSLANWGEETAASSMVAEPGCGQLNDEQSVRLACINQVLRREDAFTRLAVTLRHEKDLTYQEIAEIVQLRPATIRMRILRFRKRARTAWLDHRASDRNVRHGRTGSRTN